MNQIKTANEATTNNQGQGFHAQPRVFLTKDGEYLVHILPGNMMLKKHVNFYKKVLGIDFTPKSAMERVA